LGIRLAFALLGPTLLGTAEAGEDRLSVTVSEFAFVDTSGEARDQTAEHRAWLRMFSDILRADIKTRARFDIVNLECPTPDCAVTDPEASKAVIASAARTGARYLVFGGLQKTSTLVQWARLVVLDLTTREIVVDRLFTFRGDTEEAWRHAAHTVARYVDDVPSGE
jgi:hypothetical protein